MTSNTPTEEIGYPEGYVLHILFIKLWEWEGIKEHWETQMMKHGPFQEGAEWCDTATIRIKELKIAIAKLKSPNPINTTP
jgi:hypothetical protein